MSLYLVSQNLPCGSFSLPKVPRSYRSSFAWSGLPFSCGGDAATESDLQSTEYTTTTTNILISRSEERPIKRSRTSEDLVSQTPRTLVDFETPYGLPHGFTIPEIRVSAEPSTSGVANIDAEDTRSTELEALEVEDAVSPTCLIDVGLNADLGRVSPLAWFDSILNLEECEEDSGFSTPPLPVSPLEPPSDFLERFSTASCGLQIAGGDDTTESYLTQEECIDNRYEEYIDEDFEMLTEEYEWEFEATQDEEHQFWEQDCIMMADTTTKTNNQHRIASGSAKTETLVWNPLDRYLADGENSTLAPSQNRSQHHNNDHPEPKFSSCPEIFGDSAPPFDVLNDVQEFISDISFTLERFGFGEENSEGIKGESKESEDETIQIGERLMTGSENKPGYLEATTSKLADITVADFETGQNQEEDETSYVLQRARGILGIPILEAWMAKSSLIVGTSLKPPVIGGGAGNSGSSPVGAALQGPRLHKPHGRKRKASTCH